MISRIIIAGGGTGGHIFPAIAVANAIKKIAPETELLFIGALGKMEMEKVPQAGYKIVGLIIAGFNRSNPLKNLSLPFKLIHSFFRVRSIISKFKPDAVFGVGGYSSFPVLKQAQLMGIKTYLHESNAFAGKSNMLLGKKATKVFVATNGMDRFFPAEKILITGNPIREAIANINQNSSAAKAQFGLDANKKTLLVIGGSLGASTINRAVTQRMDTIINAGLQLIWQSGKGDLAKAKLVSEGHHGVWVSDFITDMASAYAAADLVISRSGAMSVSELCFVGKPVIFVPYPFAAEDHQTANAMALVKKDAALIVANSEAESDLINTALALAQQPNECAKLAHNIRNLAIPNADKTIAENILNLMP